MVNGTYFIKGFLKLRNLLPVKKREVVFGRSAEMNYEALLNRSEDWLKYAIHLNLLHEPKEALGDLRLSVLHNEKIKSF